MTLITLLLFVIAILWLIEKSITIIVQFLAASKGITKFIRKLLFGLFVIGVFFFPEETGTILRPIFGYIQVIISKTLLVLLEVSSHIISSLRGSPFKSFI